MLRRLAWGFALLAGAVVVGAPLWVQTHRADLPDAGDADLLAVEAADRTGPNGFDALRAAAAAVDRLDQKEVYERIDRVRRREAWEPQLVEELLQRNADAFTALDRALAAPRAWIPLREDSTDVSWAIDLLVRVQLLVKLASADAQQLAGRGDRMGAFRRALLGLQVGRWISQLENGNLLSTMFAVACQGIAFDEIERLVRETRLSAIEAKDLAAGMESQRIPNQAWRRTWAVEYRFTKAIMLETLDPDAAAEGVRILESNDAESEAAPIWLRWLPEDYLYQPNRTQSLFAARARERQDRSALSCREALALDPEARSGVDRRLRILLAPNPVGNILYEIATPNFDRFDWKRCHNDSKLGLVQLAVALRAYTQANGELPESLDALVPGYLEAIPLDRFDGAPLRYSKAKAIVYSIGDDLVDSGGFEPPAQGEHSEPTISVVF